jgi:predicted PurR-regulated permease PerM
LTVAVITGKGWGTVTRQNIQKTTLILLVIAISALFFAMIKGFIITLLLAGIFAGILYTPYQKLLTLFREHKALASLCTILIFVLVVVIPLLAFFGIVANQALDISRSAAPWIEEQIRQPDRIYEWLTNLPGFKNAEPYRDDILKKLASIVGNVGNFAVRALSAATTGTVSFFFQFFIFLYALYFFLIDGEALLRKILYYLPLGDKDESRLVEKFNSVTRATIKGTLLIGVIQGTAAGLGLWVAGVGGAVFWGAVMVVLSIIPGIGTALVWVPAAVYLAAIGRVAPAVVLALYCGLIVGSVDNLLRPRLVGKDTKLPDLMILLGTLGGILLFGVSGFIIGPIIAAIFVTAWDIYGHAFEYALASRPPQSRRRRSKPRRKPDQPRRDDTRQR